MKVFIVLETADIEVIALHVCRELEEAERLFEAIAVEVSQVPEVPLEDLGDELRGTLRFSGDHVAAVQLIERSF